MPRNLRMRSIANVPSIKRDTASCSSAGSSTIPILDVPSSAACDRRRRDASGSSSSSSTMYASAVVASCDETMYAGMEDEEPLTLAVTCALCWQVLETALNARIAEDRMLDAIRMNTRSKVVEENVTIRQRHSCDLCIAQIRIAIRLWPLTTILRYTSNVSIEDNLLTGRLS